ncbi:MAG: DUF2911 domain-containing protein [Ignavibacteria bacterium]|nr:DUF2911 domain-containing protein [Ignavibacteria bacterium]
MILNKNYAVFFLLFVCGLFAQPARPMLSQYAEVKQRIGLTDVSVSYHRPGVKNREIWGKLVPYNQIWRAGANNATVVEFSDDVKVNGEIIKAGKYSFFVIPSSKSFNVIFNSEWDQWGAFFIDTAKNVLNIEVKPEKSSFCEWLTYCFDDINIYSAKLKLKWENLAVPILVEAFTDEAMLKLNNDALNNAMMQHYYTAVAFLENKSNLDTALVSIQKSINIQGTFDNLKVKAELLALQEKWKEAVAAGEKAISVAGESSPKFYVEQFSEKVISWKKKTK